MKSKLIEYINTHYSFEKEYERIFGTQIWGRKMYCPNPLHDNRDTPAAAYYKDSNSCYCFVCRRPFGVYDLWNAYDKQSIENLRQSMIIPESNTEQTRSRRIRIVNVDRALPLVQIYTQILIENNLYDF